LRTGADRQRLSIERRAITALTAALRKQLALAIRNTADVPHAAERLALGEQGLKDAALLMIESAALLGVDIGRKQVDVIMGVEKQHFVDSPPGLDPYPRFGQDWTLVNGEATAFATQRAGDLIRELNHTSRDVIRKSVAQWTETGDPLSVLEKQLQQTGFNRTRARMIAQTETTRAYAEGNIKAWKASGLVTQQEWRTANDEAVCPICAPLGGISYGAEGAEPASIVQQERSAQRTSIGGTFSHPGGGGLASGLAGGSYQHPPAHPNCRCWLVPVVFEVPFEPIPEPITQPGIEPPTPAAQDIRKQIEEAAANIKERLKRTVSERERLVERLRDEVLDDEELAEIEEQIMELAKRDEYEELAEEQREIYTQILEQGKRTSEIEVEFYVSETRPVASVNKRAANRAVEWLERVTDGFQSDTTLYELRPEDNQRAYYAGHREIILENAGEAQLLEDWHEAILAGEIPEAGPEDIDKYELEWIEWREDDLAKTVVHEFGHRIEDPSHGYEQDEVGGGESWYENGQEFFKERTKGERARTLNEINNTTRYGADEIAKCDEFIDCYTGKIYKQKASEIYSMGLQMLYQDAGKFAEEDPGHFDFTVNALRRTQSE
jgi:SPP1 gp7 family putative phage head morphogenesis protein